KRPAAHQLCAALYRAPVSLQISSMPPSASTTLSKVISLVGMPRRYQIFWKAQRPNFMRGRVSLTTLSYFPLDFQEIWNNGAGMKQPTRTPPSLDRLRGPSLPAIRARLQALMKARGYESQSAWAVALGVKVSRLNNAMTTGKLGKELAFRIYSRT